jgi:hypothetical protein
MWVSFAITPIRHCPVRQVLPAVQEGPGPERSKNDPKTLARRQPGRFRLRTVHLREARLAF